VAQRLERGCGWGRQQQLCSCWVRMLGMVGWVAGAGWAQGMHAAATRRYSESPAAAVAFVWHLQALVGMVGAQPSSPPLADASPLDSDTVLTHTLRVWFDGEGPIVALLQKAARVGAQHRQCVCVRVCVTQSRCTCRRLAMPAHSTGNYNAWLTTRQVKAARRPLAALGG
jgi:hypothetical protein